MNNKLFYLSLIELAVSLIIGVLVLYVVYKLFRSWFKKRYEVEDDALAFNILMAAILFATGYLISGALQPINTTFKVLQGLNMSQALFIWECIKYTSIYIFIGLLVSLLSSFVTLLFYNAITKNVDELEEVAKGKIAYAIFMAAIVIAITLFIKDAYTNLVESMIPYPDLPFMPR